MVEHQPAYFLRKRRRELLPPHDTLRDEPSALAVPLEMPASPGIYRAAVRLAEVVEKHCEPHGKLRHRVSHRLADVRPYVKIVVDAVLIEAYAGLYLG